MREDWVEIRLEELISNVPTSNNKVKQREYLQNGYYPVIDQGQELIGGYIDDEEKIVECNLPVIVFGDHTKIVKYINFKFAPGADGTKILEPKRMVEPKYLYYVTKFIAKKIEDRGYARHYQYLRKENVFVAPAPEQRAIVARVEELFSELDSGIDSLKKARKQLEVYRQAVLKSAFEGKLTKEWRKETKNLCTANDLIKEIEEERSHYYNNLIRKWKDDVKKWEKGKKTEGKPSKPRKIKKLTPFSREEIYKFGKLPVEWEWTKIDKIQGHGTYSLKAGPFGSSLKKAFYVNEGYKIYGQEQVISGDWTTGDYYIDEKKYKELESCVVNPQDVLISLVGTVGRVLILPENIKKGVINPRLVKVSLLKGYYLPKFFKYYFESAYLKNIYSLKSHGATMKILNLSIIRELPFPLLTIEEQEEIIKEIETRLSVCENIEANIDEAIKKAEALRQSIFKKAFEGKLLSKEELEVCKQEDDWEPAEKLLKRIKEATKEAK